MSILVVFLSFAAADHNNAEFSNWNIQIMSHPYSFAEVSNGSNTVQIVNLTTDSGQIITPDDLNGRATWNYNGTGFNETGGNLTYLRDGLWYMAGILPGNGTLEFSAEGTTNSDTMPNSPPGTETNVTRHISFGNLTVDVLTFEELNVSDKYLMNLSEDPERNSIGKVKAGKKVSFEVNVYDEYNRQNEDRADVYVWFTNGSWVSNPQEIANYDNDSQFYYNDRVQIPRGTNSTYVAHINASSGANFNGVESFVFRTHPAIKGHISRMETAAKCEPLSFPAACEPGAKISTTLNITAAQANKANLSIMVSNATGDYKYATKRMAKQGSSFTADITIPRVNNTLWDEDITLRYNASNEDRALIVTHDITVETFFIRDETELTAYQGSKFPIEIFFGRPITLDTYPKDYMKNATVTIRDPEGSIFTQFNLSQMTFDNGTGIWTNEVLLPANVSNETYTIDVVAYDIYNVRKELSPNSGFRIRNITKSFEVADSVTFQLNKTGNFTRNVTFENMIGSQTVIGFNVTGSISEVMTVGNGSNITLPGASTAEVPFHFSIDTVQDYTGNITFYDEVTGYNKTVDVKVDAPDCGIRNVSLCTDWSGWMNITTNEREEISKHVMLYYIGEFNTSTQVSATVTGPAGRFVEVVEPVFGISDSRNITINFTADRPIDAKGKIVFDASANNSSANIVTIPTYFTANVTALNTSMELTPSNVDFGVLPEGSSHTASIQVNNTGSLDLSNFRASSSTFTVSVDSQNVSAGEVQNITLNFESISSGDGNVEIRADSRRETVSQTISVTGSVMPTFDEINSQLSQRIRDLETRTSDSMLASNVSGVNTLIDQIQTQMDQGNYAEAQETYTRAQNRLDSLEQRISEQNTNPPEQPGGGEEPPGGSPGNEEQGGGLPIILIAGVLFLLLVVGFVLYTSYIPEEGDPLYSVLGGE